MAPPLPDPHEEKDVGQVFDARLARRLIGYLGPYEGTAAGALALVLLASLLQLLGPLYVALALDLYIRPPEDAAATSWLARTVGDFLAARDWDDLPAATGVAWLAGLWVVTIIGGFFVVFAQSYVMQLMGQKVLFDLRRDLFSHLQRLHVSYFDRRPVGRLVTRVTNDVDALAELFGAGLLMAFGDLVLLVGIVAVLFALDWRLALVSFAVLPLLGLLTAWFKKRARRSYREVRTRLARINAYLQEHIGGMPIVQLFGQEKRSAEEFAEINDAHRVAHVDAIRYYAFYFPAVELITAIGLALVVGYGGGQILAGTLSIGALVAFLQYVQRFYQPLADLSEKYNLLQAAMASSERIFELLDTEAEIVSPENAHRPAAGERLCGAVEFSGVGFSYVPGEEVLRDVSFRVEPGETVAIVGHTGAGKTTLANLVLRFYDVDEGSITVDGVDVRAWDLDALRGGVAMVLQDVFLFRGSLADNIRLGGAAGGDEPIDAERLEWAAGEVRADELIERLPEGFETVVRERGAGLSMGQRQLIAFARALAFDPSLLILDEATASVDSETERQIQVALERLLQGRTSLVIAHRLSTVQEADRILVMHEGEVRESGTHAELIEKGGLYARLVELQFGDESLAAGG